MTNTVQFSGRFNVDVLPNINQGQLVYGYFEVRPGQMAATTRMPLNFSLVLDKSGSMSGRRIEQLRDAVLLMLNQLSPSDTVSIVTFNGKTDVLVPATLAHNKAALERAVKRLSSGGTTNMAPAMKAGLNEIMKNAGSDKASRLIILTDGETEKQDDCFAEATRAGQMGIPIVALGLGADWNENLLEGIAQSGSQPGYADQIKAPDDITRIFDEVFTQMQVVAQNLSVRLLMVQGVEARRVWQVTPLIKDVSYGAVQGSTVAVDLPELSDAGAAYLIELVVPPRNPGTYRFAQAEVNYSVPSQGNAQEKVQLNMMAEIAPSPNPDQRLDRDIMNIVERVTAFRLQTQALDEAAMGNLVGATRKLREAHTRLLSQGEMELAKTVLEEAERLDQGQELSNQGKKTMKLQSRKTVRLSDLNIDIP